jgi:predicted RNA polymerase sigma factor
MELNASRATARVSPSGEPIRLSDQNRGLWDHVQIERGLLALARAEADGQPRGPYWLQAAIAACHARARTAAETDWSRIAALYGELVVVAPSPIVELNRAIAVSMAEGPEAALAIVDRLSDEPLLRTYHLLPAARAEFLVKVGRMDDARAEFERAASLTRNARQRDRLLERAAGCIVASRSGNDSR